MSLRPDQTGRGTPHDDRIFQAQIEQFEKAIDSQLRANPAGAPFRTRLTWMGGVDRIAQRLAEKYRAAGWRRVVVEPEGLDACWISLEP